MNKYQDALNRIVSNDYLYFDEEINGYKECKDTKRHDISMIQKLVDKATPTEVEGLSITYEGLVGNCPYCGEFVVEWSDKPDICECGQELIWKGDQK